jgi:hypothetical protein
MFKKYDIKFCYTVQNLYATTPRRTVTVWRQKEVQHHIIREMCAVSAVFPLSCTTPVYIQCWWGQSYFSIYNLNMQIDEPATNSKNKNIRELYRWINTFERGYQPRRNVVKDENGNLPADSHNILYRWKNYFSQLLNVHRVSDVRQIEIRTAKHFITWSQPFWVWNCYCKVEKV